MPGAQWVLSKQGRPHTRCFQGEGDTVLPSGVHGSTRERRNPAAVYTEASREAPRAGAPELGYSPGKDQKAGHRPARKRLSCWLTLRWGEQPELGVAAQGTGGLCSFILDATQGLEQGRAGAELLWTKVTALGRGPELGGGQQPR